MLCNLYISLSEHQMQEFQHPFVNCLDNFWMETAQDAPLKLMSVVNICGCVLWVCPWYLMAIRKSWSLYAVSTFFPPPPPPPPPYLPLSSPTATYSPFPFPSSPPSSLTHLPTCPTVITSEHVLLAHGGGVWWRGEMV